MTTWCDIEDRRSINFLTKIFILRHLLPSCKISIIPCTSLYISDTLLLNVLYCYLIERFFNFASTTESSYLAINIAPEEDPRFNLENASFCDLQSYISAYVLQFNRCCRNKKEEGHYSDNNCQKYITKFLESSAGDFRNSLLGLRRTGFKFNS